MYNFLITYEKTFTFLSKKSSETLNKLGYKNIKFKIGDGYKGWKEYSPFDKIIITCAPEEIPDELIRQLKDGGIKTKSVMPVRFVPMIKEVGP